MGNAHKTTDSTVNFANSKMEFTPVNQFIFHECFEILEDNTANGLCFNDIYVPVEILRNILSFVPSQNLLNLSLVCKNWCNVIKSETFWIELYNRKYPNKAKILPWYVYYCYFTTNNFQNLLKNGNGQDQFEHWKVLKNLGDRFIIENPPVGCDPLPPNVTDFNGKTSCFTTSYYECNKIQKISFQNKRLLCYILNKYMPHIYISEWVAGRFDCGCMYKLGIRGYSDNEGISLDSISQESLPMPLFYETKTIVIKQWEGRKWEKVEIFVEKYQQNINVLIFEHEGHDTQFWKGHYGSKMAGGVVKFLFDTIQPLVNVEESKSQQFYSNIDIDM